MQPIKSAGENLDVAPVLPIPPWLLENSERQVEAGDRQAVSTIIGVYTYTSKIFDMMRYTAALNTTLQSLLVKCNRYGPYASLFRDISQAWNEARLQMANQENYGVSQCIFTRIELILKIVAEREGLTQNSREVYDGRASIIGAEAPASPEEDLYAL